MVRMGVAVIMRMVRASRTGRRSLSAAWFTGMAAAALPFGNPDPEIAESYTYFFRPRHRC
jgi:hypothetical protein